jgi:hypothetical protein
VATIAKGCAVLAHAATRCYQEPLRLPAYSTRVFLSMFHGGYTLKQIMASRRIRGSRTGSVERAARVIAGIGLVNCTKGKASNEVLLASSLTRRRIL